MLEGATHFDGLEQVWCMESLSVDVLRTASGVTGVAVSGEVRTAIRRIQVEAVVVRSRERRPTDYTGRRVSTHAHCE